MCVSRRGKQRSFDAVGPGLYAIAHVFRGGGGSALAAYATQAHTTDKEQL
jgi:hypothetical protein